MDTQLRECEKRATTTAAVLSVLVPLSRNTALVLALPPKPIEDLRQAHWEMVQTIDASRDETIDQRAAALLACYKRNARVFAEGITMAFRVAALPQAIQPGPQGLKEALESFSEWPITFPETLHSALASSTSKDPKAVKELLSIVDSDVAALQSVPLDETMETAKKQASKLPAAERSFVEGITPDQLIQPLCYGAVLVDEDRAPARIAVVGEVLVIVRQKAPLIACSTKAFTLTPLATPGSGNQAFVLAICPEKEVCDLLFGSAAASQTPLRPTVHFLYLADTANTAFSRQLLEVSRMSRTLSAERSVLSAKQEGAKASVGWPFSILVRLLNHFGGPLGVEQYTDGVEVSVSLKDGAEIPCRMAAPAEHSGRLLFSFTPPLARSIQVTATVGGKHIVNSPLLVSCSEPAESKDARAAISRQQAAPPAVQTVLKGVDRACLLALPVGCRVQRAAGGKQLVFVTALSGTSAAHPLFGDSQFAELVGTDDSCGSGTFVEWNQSLVPLPVPAAARPLLSLADGTVCFEQPDGTVTRAVPPAAK